MTPAESERVHRYYDSPAFMLLEYEASRTVLHKQRMNIASFFLMSLSGTKFTLIDVDLFNKEFDSWRLTASYVAFCERISKFLLQLFQLSTPQNWSKVACTLDYPICTDEKADKRERRLSCSCMSYYMCYLSKPIPRPVGAVSSIARWMPLRIKAPQGFHGLHEMSLVI